MGHLVLYQSLPHKYWRVIEAFITFKSFSRWRVLSCLAKPSERGEVAVPSLLSLRDLSRMCSIRSDDKRHELDCHRDPKSKVIMFNVSGSRGLPPK
jgi:hypothetical protein